MSNKRKDLMRVVPAGVVALTLLLAGCGGATNSGSTSTGISRSDGFSPESLKEAGATGGFKSSSETGLLGLEADEEGDDYASTNEISTPTSSDDSQSNESAEELSDTMIRKNADIDLNTREFDKATQTLSGIIKKYSVVTLQDDTDTDGYYKGSTPHHSRSVQFRIKSEQFDELCDLVTDDQTWEVKSLNKDAQDVTKQYSDTEQRIEALQTRYEWYKKKLEETTDPNLAKTYAESMFDSLDEITSLQNQNSELRTDVQYSIISIRLSEDTTVEDINPSNGIWDDLGDEVTVLPDRILGAFGMFLYVVIKILPTLIILALIGLIIFLIARPFAKRSKKKREERMKAMQAAQTQRAMQQAPRPAYAQRPGAPRSPHSAATPSQPAPPAGATPTCEETTRGIRGTATPTTNEDLESVGSAPAFEQRGVVAKTASHENPVRDTDRAETPETERIPAVLMNIGSELPVADYKPADETGDGMDTQGEEGHPHVGAEAELLEEPEHDSDESDKTAETVDFDGGDFGNIDGMFGLEDLT